MDLVGPQTKKNHPKALLFMAGCEATVYTCIYTHVYQIVSICINRIILLQEGPSHDDLTYRIEMLVKHK